MQFFEVIDTDRFLTAVYGDIQRAISEWRDGGFQDENSFSHDATRVLNRRRRKCDAGKFGNITVKSDLHVLHRQDPELHDKFGSDVAVTLSLMVNSVEEFRKAVFFQVKRSVNYQFRIKRDQLEAALALPVVRDRAFVFVVDQEQSAVRIRKTTDIMAEFEPTRQHPVSHGFNCSDWDGFTVWLQKWLKCEEGAASDINEQQGIKRLLGRHVLRAPIVPEQTNDILPAKEWLDFQLRAKLSRNDQLTLGNSDD